MKIQTKKAWLVESWTSNIVEGIAFELSIHEYQDYEAIMFSKDNGKTFAVIKSYNSDKVFFEQQQAVQKSKDTKKDAIVFYQKQIKEYQDRIDALKNGKEN